MNCHCNNTKFHYRAGIVTCTSCFRQAPFLYSGVSISEDAPKASASLRASIVEQERDLEALRRKVAAEVKK